MENVGNYLWEVNLTLLDRGTQILGDPSVLLIGHSYEDETCLRQPFIEYGSRWKTTFNGRQHLMEDNL